MDPRIKKQLLQSTEPYLETAQELQARNHSLRQKIFNAVVAAAQNYFSCSTLAEKRLLMLHLLYCQKCHIFRCNLCLCLFIDAKACFNCFK
jgi:hypothetical protein